MMQEFVDEILGTDGELWHLLKCGHLKSARCSTLGNVYTRQWCMRCAGFPSEIQPLDHHVECRCRRCVGPESHGERRQ
jgi:hypothetical protein